MPSKSYVITGSNRGLGIEFVRQLCLEPSTVIYATVRSIKNSYDDLQSLSDAHPGQINILECDTSSTESIHAFGKAVMKELDGTQLNVLINNAGINAVPERTVLTVTPKEIQQHIDTNVIGPAELVKVLLPSFASGSVIVNMTSGLGSCALQDTMCAAYAISKAALNMLTVHQAAELRDRKIHAIVMNPGWVKTEMGGAGAKLEPEESISGMLKVIHGVGARDTGTFYNHDGTTSPW